MMSSSFLLHKIDVADWEMGALREAWLYVLANSSPETDASIPGSLDVPGTGLKWPRTPSNVPRTGPRCPGNFQAPRTTSSSSLTQAMPRAWHADLTEICIMKRAGTQQDLKATGGRAVVTGM
jgi:hypothetical protein